MTLRGKPPQKGSDMSRSRKTLKLAVFPAVTAGALFAAAASPAFAEQGQNTWTTYLYQGPSTHYMVIGEVPQATAFDIVGCKDAWCEVSFEGRRGFIMSEVVTTGDPSKPAPGLLTQPASGLVAEPAGPCFVVNQKGGNGGNEMTYICQK